MIRALIDPPPRSPRSREIFDPILSSCSWEKWLLPRSTWREHLHICGDISGSCRFKARMAAREVKMIVARYFSTIRHPPVLVASAFCPELFRLFQSTTTEFARPSRLAHWGDKLGLSVKVPRQVNRIRVSTAARQTKQWRPCKRPARGAQACSRTRRGEGLEPNTRTRQALRRGASCQSYRC